MVPDSTCKIITAPFSNTVFKARVIKTTNFLTCLICYSEQSNTNVNKLMFTEFHKWNRHLKFLFASLSGIVMRKLMLMFWISQSEKVVLGLQRKEW